MSAFIRFFFFSTWNWNFFFFWMSMRQMNFVFRCLQLSMDLLTTVFSSFFPPFALLSFVLLLLFFLSELRISLPSYPFFYGLFLLILFFFLFFIRKRKREREREKKKCFQRDNAVAGCIISSLNAELATSVFFFFSTTGSPILTPFFFFFSFLFTCVCVFAVAMKEKEEAHTQQKKKRTNGVRVCVCFTTSFNRGPF